MDAEKFVKLCEELLKLGATEVHAGVYRAHFPRQQQLMHGPKPREPVEPHGPPKARDPDEARRERYAAIMGEGR